MVRVVTMFLMKDDGVELERW